MSDKRDILIDFNSVEDDRVVTLLDAASAWASVHSGLRLIAGDDQGNLCDATVLSVTADGVVELVLDEGTFRTAGSGHLAALA